MRSAFGALTIAALTAGGLSAQTLSLAGRPATPPACEVAAGSPCYQKGGVCAESPTELPQLLRNGVRYWSPAREVELRRRGISGHVDMEFVVDSSGRVEAGTANVLYSDDALFTAAVEEVLPLLWFRPGKVGQRRARVVTQQRFTFKRPY